MFRLLPAITFLALNVHCAEDSKPQSARTPNAPPAPAGPQSAAAEGARNMLHFFSVAWGCVEVDKARLDAAAYTLQDVTPLAGSCPASLKVLTAQSAPLLSCPVVIGPKAISATYVLYDKRTLDGKTLSDLKAEGFTEANFCPAVAQRKFN